MMNLARPVSPALPAFAILLLFAACVDLSTPWADLRDAGVNFDARVNNGGTLAPGTDAGGGGSGGASATGGTATDGAVASGGTTGHVVADVGSVGDAAATRDAREDGTGDTVDAAASDAEAGADTLSHQDVGVEDLGQDVPIFADAPLAPDRAAGDASLSEAGSPDGARIGDGDAPAVDGRDSAEAGAAAKALIISIDFVGGRPTGSSGSVGTTVMGASESAGVKSATHWNSAVGAEGTIPALVSASGDVTAATASWSVPSVDSAPDIWSVSMTDTPGDQRMMNGYLDPRASSSPASITVTGLPTPPGSGFDVYVYSFSDVASGVTRVSQYSIGSTTYSVTQIGTATDSFSGYSLASTGNAGNYVVFRNVIGSGFTLIARPGSSFARAPVNGIQIAYPSGS